MQSLPYRLQSPSLTKLLLKGQEPPNQRPGTPKLRPALIGGSSEDERSIRNFNPPVVPLREFWGEQLRQHRVSLGEEKPRAGILHKHPTAEM